MSNPLCTVQKQIPVTKQNQNKLVTCPCQLYYTTSGEQYVSVPIVSNILVLPKCIKTWYMGTLKPQSNTVICTLAVDGGCYIWYSEEGPERAGAPPSPLLAVPNVTARLSTASVPTSYYLM